MIDIVKDNIQLWALQLVPSLLPYMIISTLILELSNRYISINYTHKNKVSLKNNSFSINVILIFLAGHLCGYPIGAKLVADAYNNDNISYEESNYLLSVCNQASPAFLQYYVGQYILNGTLSASTIYIIFYTATIITAFLMKFYYLNKSITHSRIINKTLPKQASLTSILDDSITQSCTTILKVGGYIVIFSLISNFLLKLIPDSFTYLPIIFSTIEITTGLLFIKSYSIPLSWFIPIVMSITAFGGICTMAQIKGMLIRTSLSLKPYIVGKIIYMIIVFIMSLLFIQFKILNFNI